SCIKYFLLMMVFICAACNDEWKEEQFEHFVSFKAPLTAEGVSNIFVRYKGNEKTVFHLPLIVSGSTEIAKDINVRVELDPDTLNTLNFERFQNREDFYYRKLDDHYFSIPSTVAIQSGERTALMPIDFTFNNIDMVDKWVLPITIVGGDANGYQANPRKHYRKAILRI